MLQTFWDMILYGDPATGGSWKASLLAMGASLAIGHVIAWIYMLSHVSLSYSRTFVCSLLIIPVLVSMMMLLVTGNLVIAFGLLAVFAVVRFRNVLKDTRDTTFILWAIVEGMAVGTKLYGTALIGCGFISLVYAYMRLTGFGIRHRYDVMLTLQWNAPEPARMALTPLLRRHSARTQLVSQRGETGEVDLSYRLLLRDPSRGGELLDELRNTKGVEHASLYMREDESEM